MRKGSHDLDAVRSLVRAGRYLLTRTKAREPVLEALGGDLSLLGAFVGAVAEALDNGFWIGSCLLQDGRPADEYVQRLPDEALERFGLGEPHRHWYVKIVVDHEAAGGSVAFISLHPPTKGVPVRILNQRGA